MVFYLYGLSERWDVRLDRHIQCLHFPSSFLYFGFFSFANTYAFYLKDLCSHSGNTKIQTHTLKWVPHCDNAINETFSCIWKRCSHLTMPGVQSSFKLSNWTEHVRSTSAVTSATVPQHCCLSSKKCYEIIQGCPACCHKPNISQAEFLVSWLPISFICITTSDLWKQTVDSAFTDWY